LLGSTISSGWKTLSTLPDERVGKTALLTHPHPLPLSLQTLFSEEDNQKEVT